MIEWTPPDRHKIQVALAEVWGWQFYDYETQNNARVWLHETYPGCSGIGFYEDCLEETNAIFFFDTEEQFTMWMMKHG